MLGRRREDPRPPIEVIGDDRADDEDLARVTVGGEPGRSHRVLVAAVAAAVAVVAISVTIGGDDPEEGAGRRTTTSRDGSDRTTRTSRSTTSTTPAAITRHGPQLPVQTGVALLVGGVTPGGWVHLDLDTGTRTTLGAQNSEQPHVVGVSGGAVVSARGEARYVPLPSGTPVELGPGGYVLPGSRPDEVWLVAGGPYEPDALGSDPVTARLVEVTSGDARSRVVELPRTGVVRSTSRGLVLTGGGRIYLVERDGGIRPLGTGDLHAASGRYVLRSTCDDDAECEVEALDVESGLAQPLDVDLGPHFGFDASVSPAGEVALTPYGPKPEVLLGTLGGSFVATGARPYGTFTNGWLPDGQGFVGVDGPTGDVVRLIPRDGGTVERRPVEALAGDRADYVVVIPP